MATITLIAIIIALMIAVVLTDEWLWGRGSSGHRR
jgi:hypothetical protein